MWDVVQAKRAETFAAYLLASRKGTGSWAIGVVRPNTVAVWEGIAVFPDTMLPEAVRRFQDLHTDIDVEDLMREWGSEEAELDDFELFLAEEDGQ